MKTKVSSKGQVVIPKSVRSHFHWKPGTVLNIEKTENGVALSPVKNDLIPREDVFGCLKGKVSKRVSLEEMDAVIAKLSEGSR